MEHSAAPTDAELVEALSNGDKTALAGLYDRHSGRMLGVAIAILGNRSDAEDLLHDVFVEVWRKAESYDQARGTVAYWLLMRMRSRALDRRRALALLHRKTELLTEKNEGPADVAKEYEVGAPMNKLMTALPQSQLQVIQLNYYYGLTCSEIATEIDVPIGTVKSRLSAALGKLRQQMSVLGVTRDG